MSVDTDDRTSDSPLSHADAVRLDEQIQDTAGKAGERLDNLSKLLAEAQTGQIHTALSYISWPAYVADRLKPIAKVLTANERSVLIVGLHEAGMSSRAIAEALDTSKSSIHRQVSQSGTGDLGGKVNGLDDKQYPRRNHGGGHRGPLPTVMVLKRVGSTIANITGLEEEDAERQKDICRLIDELLASIEPVTESTGTERN